MQRVQLLPGVGPRTVWGIGDAKPGVPLEVSPEQYADAMAMPEVFFDPDLPTAASDEPAPTPAPAKRNK